MQPPDTLHNALAWIVAGLLLGFGFAAGEWIWSINTPTGKIIALVVLVILAALFIWGQV